MTEHLGRKVHFSAQKHVLRVTPAKDETLEILIQRVHAQSSLLKSTLCCLHQASQVQIAGQLPSVNTTCFGKTCNALPLLSTLKRWLRTDYPFLKFAKFACNYSLVKLVTRQTKPSEFCSSVISDELISTPASGRVSDTTSRPLEGLTRIPDSV